MIIKLIIKLTSKDIKLQKNFSIFKIVFFFYFHAVFLYFCSFFLYLIFYLLFLFYFSSCIATELTDFCFNSLRDWNSSYLSIRIMMMFKKISLEIWSLKVISKSRLNDYASDGAPATTWAIHAVDSGRDSNRRFKNFKIYLEQVLCKPNIIY